MLLVKLRESVLKYHSLPIPGKIAIDVFKPTTSQFNLSLAYSPGVSMAVEEIKKNEENVYKYTSKGNLIAIITNGTAVLGMGNVGVLASKPVMEGKVALFKLFSNIDSFNIEINESCVNKFVDTVLSISSTFSGINLEDIKAPECFKIEEKLSKYLNIPVFHDDQHGTAVVVAAGLLNALYIQDKIIDNIKLVCFGAGAAGIATMNLLLKLGLKKENIYMIDSKGLIHTGRKDLNIYKIKFARDCFNTIVNTVKGSDIFLGLSSGNIFTPKMLRSMSLKPIVFALSNPIPEIHPDIVNSIRNDAIIATGRSDFYNQVNNLLCFPYIFRGALDVRAKKINSDMLIAAVHAIKELARKPVPKSIIKAYNMIDLEFGKKYILPLPIDYRLIQFVSKSVSCAAIK